MTFDKWIVEHTSGHPVAKKARRINRINGISQTPQDCYEVAAAMRTTPQEAVMAMREAGWEFIGYNDSGEEVHAPTCPIGMKARYNMFILYEKLVHSPFCGDGRETIVSDKTGKILAHTRSWDEPSVVEDFKGLLKGKSLKDRGIGWRKVSGEKLLRAQEWAWEVVNWCGL